MPRFPELSLETFDWSRLTLGLAFAVVAGAAFLPWVTFEVAGDRALSRTGTSGDGLITLVLALVGLTFIVLRGGRWSNYVVVFLATVSLFLSLHDIRDLNIGEFLKDEPANALRERGAATAHPAIGLYLTVLGSAVAVVTSVLRSWRFECQSPATTEGATS